MTNTKWVLLQFIIFCDKQAQKSSFARRHTHTYSSQAENLFQIFPWARPELGLFQTLGWTWTRLGENNFGHRQPWTTSGANPKPGSRSGFAGSVHSHRMALNYKWFGGKAIRALTSNLHPSHRGSQITLSKRGAGNGSSYISTCHLLSGWVLLASAVCVLVTPSTPSPALVST